MTKKIISREELIAPKLSGMKMIAGVVKATLGPGGSTILLQRQGQSLDGTDLGPRITKDGVSVADECSSPNPVEDIVIQAVKAICKKTNTVAGDGTTTAIVLGEALVNETEAVLKSDPTLNPQLVKESIENALKDVLKLLKKMTIPIKLNMVGQVATISANGDETIGRVIAEAFSKVGAEGVVTVDEGRTSKVTLEVVEGYQFNRGAEGRNAFFNNQQQTQFEAEKCVVIIYDGKLFNYSDIIPALKILAGITSDSEAPTKKIPPILLIANEFSNEVLTFLNIQKAEGGMQICPVTGPNVTHIRSSYYDDIAVYTGGTRLGSGSRSLAAIEEDDIGLTGKVIVDRYKTTLYDGQGTEEAILDRVAQLRALKEQAESPYDAQIIADRSAAITNGIAKICVGGLTELEIKEKYDRIEDALNAARAAIQEGVVPGGGATLLRIAVKLNPDKSVGHAILSEALKAPFYQILENIGLSELDQQKASFDVINSNRKVYDARHKRITNALAQGILDPVKVTRVALENAVSISSLLSTAGGAVVFVPPEK